MIVQCLLFSNTPTLFKERHKNFLLISQVFKNTFKRTYCYLTIYCYTYLIKMATTAYPFNLDSIFVMHFGGMRAAH